MVAGRWPGLHGSRAKGGRQCMESSSLERANNRTQVVDHKGTQNCSKGHAYNSRKGRSTTRTMVCTEKLKVYVQSKIQVDGEVLNVTPLAVMHPPAQLYAVSREEILISNRNPGGRTMLASM